MLPGLTFLGHSSAWAVVLLGRFWGVGLVPLVLNTHLMQICPPSWRFHEEMGQSAGLVANMAPAGAYSDFRFAPGGAAVWLHVVSGRKVIIAPFTPARLNCNILPSFGEQQNISAAIPV